jgi:hypothetical protein
MVPRKTKRVSVWIGKSTSERCVFKFEHMNCDERMRESSLKLETGERDRREEEKRREEMRSGEKRRD